MFIEVQWQFYMNGTLDSCKTVMEGAPPSASWNEFLILQANLKGIILVIFTILQPHVSTNRKPISI